jgi:hypothetical protein
MIKSTNRLVPGDVMASGEVVVSCNKSTPFGQGNPKATVILLNTKTGKRRFCTWNWYGTVSVKNAEKSIDYSDDDYELQRDRKLMGYDW